MIVEIKVKNYRSYKEEASLTFEALNESFNSESVAEVQLEDGNTKRLLKTAAILGPNASGKSNIARALSDVMFLAANSRDFETGGPSLSAIPSRQGLPHESVYNNNRICGGPSPISLFYFL